MTDPEAEREIIRLTKDRAELLEVVKELRRNMFCYGYDKFTRLRLTSEERDSISALIKRMDRK